MRERSTSVPKMVTTRSSVGTSTTLRQRRSTLRDDDQSSRALETTPPPRGARRGCDWRWSTSSPPAARGGACLRETRYRGEVDQEAAVKRSGSCSEAIRRLQCEISGRSRQRWTEYAQTKGEARGGCKTDRRGAKRSAKRSA